MSDRIVDLLAGRLMKRRGQTGIDLDILYEAAERFAGTLSLEEWQERYWDPYVESITNFASSHRSEEEWRESGHLEDLYLIYVELKGQHRPPDEPWREPRVKLSKKK